jgi:tetratricopeptide (TPR) repeat protein
MSILDSILSKFHKHIADGKRVSVYLDSLARWLQEIKNEVDKDLHSQLMKDDLLKELYDNKLSQSIKNAVFEYITESFTLAEGGYQEIEEIERSILGVINKIFHPENLASNREICDDLEQLIQGIHDFKKKANPITACADLLASKKPKTFKHPLILGAVLIVTIPGICYAFHKFILNYVETNCTDTMLPFYKISSVEMANRKSLGISCLKAHSKNPGDMAKLKQAKLEFEDLVKVDNMDKEATFFLETSVNLLARSKGSENRPQYPESIKLFNNYFERESPGNPSIPDEIVDIIVRLGNFLSSEQQYAQAKKYYSAALGKNKKNINASLGICTTHFDTNDKLELQKTLEDCSNAIKYLEVERSTSKDNALALAYYNKGCVQARLGDYSGSSASFKEGKKKDGVNPYLDKAYFNSLVLSDTDDKREEAIKFYSDRGDSTPEKSDADNTYAFAFGIMKFATASDTKQPLDARRKNYQKALDTFKELNQKNKIHQDYQGRTKICLNNMNSCKTNWSIKSEPNYELVDNMHKVFLAFITTYEMNPVVNNAPVVFQSKKYEELKGRFCKLRREPENEISKPFKSK